MRKLFSILFFFLITHFSYSQNTFTNTGTNVGIGTASPATLLEVKYSIDERFYGTQFVGPMTIGNNNDYGAGGAAQWLLLTPYIPGGSGIQSAGLNGTLTFYRGSNASYNVNIDYHVNIQSAYSNTIANLVPLSSNSPVIALYKVVYGGNNYVAINPADVCGSSTNISYFGYYWNNFASPQNIKPQLILASAASSFTVLQTSQAVSSNAMFVTTQKYIGIGTNTPQSLLHVVGDITAGQGAAQGTAIAGRLLISDGTNGTASINGNHTDNNNVGIDFTVLNASTALDAVSIKPTGNMVIGQPTAGNPYNANYLLDVKGFARANKLVVNTNGADFVFEPTYKLTPLNKVEAFIQANHHLPGIEPAAQMQKEGVDVGSNQAKLLQKIEELTLYVIEEHKKNSELNKTVEAQTKLLAQLLAEVEKLKKEDK
jgi:hypothetical protein